MNTVQTAGVLRIVGSTIFNFGAGIGVPRIWTEPGPHARLRMLEDRRTMWRIAQPFYGLGAIIAGAGAGYLAVDATTRSSQIVFTMACAALIVGALAWCWSLYLRGTRIEDFALGRQPGWPFTDLRPAYHRRSRAAGLSACSSAISRPGSAGSSSSPTSPSSLAYVGYRDIPPFVFYLLLLAGRHRARLTTGAPL